MQLVEVSLTHCCESAEATTGANGRFTFETPSSVYVVRANAPTAYYPALARIDLRGASSSSPKLPQVWKCANARSGSRSCNRER